MRQALQTQVALDLGGNFLRREQAQPGSRQFDAQRQALHQAADAGDRRRLLLVSWGRPPVGALAGSNFVEQQHRAVAFRRRGRLPLVRPIRREAQARKRQPALAGQVEPLARGDQQCDSWGARLDRLQLCSRRQQVLEIIQHQQHFLIAQIIQELRQGVLAPVKSETDGIGDSRRQKLGGSHARQGDKERSMPPQPGLLDACLDGQAGLADATWAGEGEQMAAWIIQRRLHLGQFNLAPDQRRGRHRKSGRLQVGDSGRFRLQAASAEQLAVQVT